jgi:hypothetical protein
MKSVFPKLTLVYLFTYLALTLLTLSRIIIPWVDEVMNVEPGFNLYSTGSLFSNLFPFEGANKKFLAYLPVTPLVHYLGFLIFPKTVFWVRFPIFLLFAVSIWMWFRLLKDEFKLEGAVFFLFILLFIQDESILRQLRGTRVEITEVFLLLAAFFIGLKCKKSVFSAIPLGLMLVTHPKVWFLAPIGLFFMVLKDKSMGHRLLGTLFFILPILIWLAFADFNIEAIKTQLFAHGEEHVAQGNLIFGHFVERFLPNYLAQPWMFVMHIAALVFASFQIIKKPLEKSTMYAWMLMSTSIFWFIKLAPFVRYNPVLVVLILLVLLVEFKTHQEWILAKFKSFLGLVMVAFWMFLLITPFLYRNTIAFSQWKERDPAIMLELLDKEINPKEKTLILDGEIGFYAAMNNPNLDFRLLYTLNTTPFSDYDNVYLLTTREEYFTLFDGVKADFKMKYEAQFPERKGIPSAGNFKGYKLFEVKNDQVYQKLRRGN